MSLTQPLSRRDFFQLSALAGGGFALGLSLPVRAFAQMPEAPILTPSAFVQIAPDGFFCDDSCLAHTGET